MSSALIPFPSSLNCSKRSFTLIEMLVTIAVIGILAGLLLPALSAARERGREADCISNLRQCGLAITMYNNHNGDYFPVVHGGTYAAPEPPTKEWWEYLEPYKVQRSHLLCRSDRHGNNTTVESYVWNGMFSFGVNRATLRGKDEEKILISERGDTPEALTHQGYPSWHPVEVWKENLDENRHDPVSNYLFADGHVAGLEWEDTLGEREVGVDSDKHFVRSFWDVYMRGTEYEDWLAATYPPAP